MKKLFAVVGTIVVLLGAYLGVAQLSGGVFPTLGLPIGGARGQLRRMATSFLEDIQFKDFKAAASFHAPAVRDSVDIPYLIERLFKVKPELLDIMDYDVAFVDLDSSGRRARVKMRVKVKFLGNERIAERELMLYFYRDSRESPWYMKLEDSLREPTPDSSKVH